MFLPHVSVSAPTGRHSNIAIKSSRHSVQSSNAALSPDQFVRFGTGRPQETENSQAQPLAEAQTRLSNARAAIRAFQAVPRDQNTFKNKLDQLCTSVRSGEQPLSSRDKKILSRVVTEGIVNLWLDAKEQLAAAKIRLAELGQPVTEIDTLLSQLPAPAIPNMNRDLIHHVRHDAGYRSTRAVPSDADTSDGLLDFESESEADESPRTPPDNMGVVE